MRYLLTVGFCQVSCKVLKTNIVIITSSDLFSFSKKWLLNAWFFTLPLHACVCVISALLRYNLHATQFTYLKCTMQSPEHFHSHKKKPSHYQSLPSPTSSQAYTTTNLLFVSRFFAIMELYSIFKVPLWCNMYRYFIPFHWQITFHYMDIARFV